jgi:carboxypeptidase PM20D1
MKRSESEKLRGDAPGSVEMIQDSPGQEAPTSSRRGGRPWLKRTLGVTTVLLLLLVSVVLGRTLLYRPRMLPVKPVEALPVDERRAAEHLARTLSIPTISSDTTGSAELAVFQQLHAALEEMFPLTHKVLRREVVADKSLLYILEGTEPSLKPILLLGHTDVVSIEQDTQADWKVPPFEGRIVDGTVWGRGARDFKLGVVASLEAVELLLERGYRPRRSVYLAFGHDEEIGGAQGAGRLSALLMSRGLQFEYVLDEGLMITTGVAPGVTAPVAMVGVAEKGNLTLELVVKSEGGHSSLPPRDTAIGVLSQALARVEARQMPLHLEEPINQLLDVLGPEMDFATRVVFANRWLFGKLLEQRLSRKPVTDALLHTTTAITLVEGGIKRTVLPRRARALINFRILPGDSVASVVEHVHKVVDDPRVEINTLEVSRFEPSPVSSTETAGYRTLDRTIREVFPSVLVAPSLFMARADARYYQDLSRAVYRFSPQRMSREEMSQLHGTNERIPVSELAEAVRFYAQLIRNSDALDTP